jgi:hypothetical protein
MSLNHALNRSGRLTRALGSIGSSRAVQSQTGNSNEATFRDIYSIALVYRAACGKCQRHLYCRTRYVRGVLNFSTPGDFETKYAGDCEMVCRESSERCLMCRFGRADGSLMSPSGSLCRALPIRAAGELGVTHAAAREVMRRTRYRSFQPMLTALH